MWIIILVAFRRVWPKKDENTWPGWPHNSPDHSSLQRQCRSALWYVYPTWENNALALDLTARRKDPPIVYIYIYTRIMYAKICVCVLVTPGIVRFSALYLPRTHWSITESVSFSNGNNGMLPQSDASNDLGGRVFFLFCLDFSFYRFSRVFISIWLVYTIDNNTLYSYMQIK